MSPLHTLLGWPVTSVREVRYVDRPHNECVALANESDLRFNFAVDEITADGGQTPNPLCRHPQFVFAFDARVGTPQVLVMWMSVGDR